MQRNALSSFFQVAVEQGIVLELGAQWMPSEPVVKSDFQCLQSFEKFSTGVTTVLRMVQVVEKDE